MKISFPYGKEKVELDIPDKNILDVITGKIKKTDLSESEIITRALKNPVKSKRLRELARGKTSACILASDITRPCPSFKFLPRLLEELKKGGIENKNIKIILGTGIHRGHTADEKRKLVGDYIYSRVEIIDSDISDTKLIGHTTRGTPVEIFKRAAGHDLLIATGNIGYHYFAGYSGGSKAVMPGICSRNSIQSNHSMMLDEKAAGGKFFNNPLRQDIEEAGRIAGIDFIFNVILDDKRNIIAAVAGKNNEAYLEGISKYDSIYRREVKYAADMVVTSQGGYPKDINLYQSHKALENVREVVADKGTIILIASCSEGFGEETFKQWMEGCRDYNSMIKKLKNKFVLGGHKAVAISRILTGADVLLYSEFARKETEKMGFIKIENIQRYIDNRILNDGRIKITLVTTGRFIRLLNQ